MTRKQIIKKIGNPHLSLRNGGGYFYFVYDNGSDAIWGRKNTHGVYCYRLNHMSLEQWVSEGEYFLKTFMGYMNGCYKQKGE